MIQAQDFEADEYTGSCSICGENQSFRRTLRAIRETYSCAACRASLREREQASALLDCFFRGRFETLRGAVARADQPQAAVVYEPGTTGALRKCLKLLPHYMQSDYYAEDHRHRASPAIPHQDLQALTFASESIDLVVSSDILEHVRRPETAFAEIARVLRPGGLHVFTVPMQDPLPAKTVSRVDTRGDVDVPLLPQAYHGDGKGGRSLVYTDFGLDIIDMLGRCGFVTELRRPRTSSLIANRAITIVSCLARSA
jgi:SAM-dependent methyltransferase